MAGFDPLNFDSPTIPVTDEAGYGYVETSEAWKEKCRALPCFAGLQWPDYDTTIISDTMVNDAGVKQDVVIQLWKGYCEQFLGLRTMPGGIGAEVGVYVRIPPGQPLPVQDKFPPWLGRYFEKLSGVGGDELWWPDPMLQPKIEFVLTNPENGKVFFAAGPQATYWRNRWMGVESYKNYQVKNGSPAFSTRYQLRYSINGKTYPVW